MTDHLWTLKSWLTANCQTEIEFKDLDKAIEWAVDNYNDLMIRNAHLNTKRMEYKEENRKLREENEYLRELIGSLDIVIDDKIYTGCQITEKDGVRRLWMRSVKNVKGEYLKYEGAVDDQTNKK